MSESAHVDPAAIGVTTLVVLEGVKLFRDLAPDIAQLRQNGGDPATTAALRSAEMLTAGVMILAGASVSYITGNSVPTWLAVISVALVIGTAEFTNRRPPA